LRPDEIITAIELPPKGFAGNYTYLKIRDRQSYAFALVSIAVGLDIANGKITEARIALGGVAHKPWRCRTAEDALRGAPATAESFARAADAELAAARPLRDNGHKVPIARNAITTLLLDLAERP
jgi:xanthine dehydrogenase YagS FAD-binding subunit